MDESSRIAASVPMGSYRAVLELPAGEPPFGYSGPATGAHHTRFAGEMKATLDDPLTES